MNTTKTFKLPLLVLVFISIGNNVFCQNAEKKNPVIFFDEFIGVAFGNAGGLAAGFGLNYQVNRNFFTARVLGTVKFGVDVLAPMVPLPVPYVKNSMGEAALLYGIRQVENNQAYSFSLGVSYSGYYQNYDKYLDTEIKYDYFGVPFEANFKWFKREKKPFKIYGLIPVGNPTAFGGSIGFKMFGNISKQSYAGVGVSYGLGFHKVYD